MLGWGSPNIPCSAVGPWVKPTTPGSGEDRRLLRRIRNEGDPGALDGPAWRPTARLSSGPSLPPCGRTGCSLYLGTGGWTGEVSIMGLTSRWGREADKQHSRRDLSARRRVGLTWRGGGAESGAPGAQNSKQGRSLASTQSGPRKRTLDAGCWKPGRSAGSTSVVTMAPPGPVVLGHKLLKQHSPCTPGPQVSLHSGIPLCLPFQPDGCSEMIVFIGSYDAPEIMLPISGYICHFSVAQSCPILGDPIDYDSPGLPVLHHLPEFAQTHAH